MSQYLSQLCSITRMFAGQISRNAQQFHTLLPKGLGNSNVTTAIANRWSLDIVRERHFHFIPNEAYRVKRSGFYAKVKTRNGRKQIMRRILKGRYVLTH